MMSNGRCASLRLAAPIAVAAGLLASQSLAQGAAVGPMSTLETIRTRGEIVIGHRESAAPFSYVGEALEPSGYMAELCNHIANEVRKRLRLDSLAVRHVPVTDETALPQLIDRAIDIDCGPTANTYARQQQADFSHTVFIAGSRLLVRAESRVQEIDHIRDGSLAVVRGTISAREVEIVLRATATEALLIPVDSIDEGFEFLADRKVWALAADDVALYALRNRMPNPAAFRVTGRLMTYEAYAIMLRRDDSGLRRTANMALSELFRDGRIEEIYKRHLEPHGIPLPPLTQAAFALQAFPEH